LPDLCNSIGEEVGFVEIVGFVDVSFEKSKRGLEGGAAY